MDKEIVPRHVADVDVVERFGFVRIPELVGAKERPVGAAQECAKEDEHHPQDQEAEEPGRQGKGALFDGVVAVAFGVDVDERHRDQAEDDDAGIDDARHPRVEVDEHFLKPQEIPRGFGGIGRVCGIGGLFERSFGDDRPDDQAGCRENQADEFRVNQIGPDEDFVVAVFFHQRKTGGDPGVIDRRPAETNPDADHHAHHHDRDRHVVGLGDDRTKILVGDRTEINDAKEDEQSERDWRLGPQFVEHEHEDEDQRRQTDEVLRPGGGVDHALDEGAREGAVVGGENIAGQLRYHLNPSRATAARKFRRLCGCARSESRSAP